MSDQMDIMGLSFLRIPAVDARAKGFKFPEQHTQLMAPEYACYLSHRKAWEMLVESDDSSACILEDDAVLSPSIAPILSCKIMAKTGADLLRVETWPFRVWISRSSVLDVNAISIRPSYLPALGTAGYIITRELALHLLTEIGTLRKPIDVTLFRTKIGKVTPKIYQCDPAPCIQKVFYENTQHTGFGDSDIHQSRLDKAKIFGTDRNGSTHSKRYKQRLVFYYHQLIRLPYILTRKTCRVKFDDKL